MSAIVKGTTVHIRNINKSPAITAATVQSFTYTKKPKIDDTIKNAAGIEIEDVLDDIQTEASVEFAVQTGFDEATIAIGSQFTANALVFYIIEFDLKEENSTWTKYTAKLRSKPGLGLV